MPGGEDPQRGGGAGAGRQYRDDRGGQALRPRDLGCRSSRRACLSHGAEPAPCPHLAWPMTDILLLPRTVPPAYWPATPRGTPVRSHPSSAPHIHPRAHPVGLILPAGTTAYYNTTRFGTRALLPILLGARGPS